VKQTPPKDKEILTVKRVAIFVAVFAVSFALRVSGPRTIGPYDDAYHWKRIAYSAAHFPRVLEFDPDRDAWCPWPPLYDLAMATAGKGVEWIKGVEGVKGVEGSLTPRPPRPLDALIWIPPIAFSLFAATLAVTVGWIAGLGVALSPYLIDVSSVAKIDHHWVEPMLVVAIVAARRRPLLLALAMIAALFVQPALIIACGLVFFVTDRSAAISFALAAAAVIAYRLTHGYPDNGWFLGWPHAALLTGAAVASLLKPRWYAIPIGAAVTLPWLPSIIEGLHFFRGDPWLRSIVEFQPLFHDPSRIGTDIANLGGGLIALLLFARRRSPAVMLFAIAYFALAISSQRFLVPGVVMFVIAGQIAAIDRKWIAAALTILPPLCYDVYSPPRATVPHFAVVDRIAALPPGRVLAPWYMGHAIDVFGHHAVVIDNFGSMPDPVRFELASEALANPRILRAYCRLNHVRYVVMRGAVWTIE
jgi:hypothetical protein